MITHKLNKQPKNTYEINVKISPDEVKKEYTKAFDQLRGELDVKGFRKGKAPVDVAKKHLQDSVVYEHVVRTILPKIYQDIVQKESLKPITSPKVEIIKAKGEEEWEFKITLAEKPEINLDNYKDIVKRAKGEEKKEEIWVPGKDKEEPKKELKDQRLLDKVLSALLKDIKVEMSDLIIEEELNRRLSQLVDDIQKLGMTTETYLKTKNTTVDKLKEQIKREITDVYSLEFMLMEIADRENIAVDQADLDKIFTNIKDTKEKEMAKQNAYYYASLMRKQKTIEYLLSL